MSEPDNQNGDNLAFDPEDDNDETCHTGWRNNPIRRLFDNPRQRSHRSFLDDDQDDDEEDTE